MIQDDGWGPRLATCEGCGWQLTAINLPAASQAFVDHCTASGCEPDAMAIYLLRHLPPRLRRTRSVFDRYNITSAADVRKALERVSAER